MADATKTCYRCGEAKPLTEFHKDRARADGIGSRCKQCTVAYNAARKSEQAAYHRAYYLANRERILARTGEYQRADPERRRAYAHRYREQNREAMNEYMAKRRAADPEREKRLGAAFRKRHPEKARRDAQRRRAMLAGVTHDPEVTREALRVRDGDSCCYCGTLLDFVSEDQYEPTRATLEHITPISRGGAHEFSNTALACRACNISKRASIFLWKWVGRRN